MGHADTRAKLTYVALRVLQLPGIIYPMNSDKMDINVFLRLIFATKGKLTSVNVSFHVGDSVLALKEAPGTSPPPSQQ